MNERNVEALARLLTEEIVANGYVDIRQRDAEAVLAPDPDFPMFGPAAAERLRAMAEWLAAHSTLVPSALTPEQCEEAAERCGSGEWTQPFVKRLEAFASGDAIAPTQ